jgi:hypothetical protein
MYIDRCGRRHRIEGQWLFATLLIGRIRLLRLLHRTNSFHPRNAVDHIPFRAERRCVENRKAARKRRAALAILSLFAGAVGAAAAVHARKKHAGPRSGHSWIRNSSGTGRAELH